MADLYVRNARLVGEDAAFHGGVLVRGGRIVEIVEGDPERPAAEVVDAGGHVLIPGLVDVHVHFNEPGRTSWEGFLTGTQAAAAGGVTTVVEMPLNASPPTIDGAALRAKQEAAARSAVIDYALWGGLVDDNRRDLDDLLDGGVAGLKAFLCTSGSDFARIDDDVLADGLAKARDRGSFVAVHAENEWVSQDLTRRLRADGRTDRRAWGEARPPSVELEAIGRALFWAAQTDGRLHVVHVSTADGIDLIAAARRTGVRVTAETCPHYLMFSEDDFVRLGPVAKCAPPLRSRAHVDALWDRVLSGDVDVIASDHSPCLPADKTAGEHDVFEAWGGISGLQSTLPALITAGVHGRGLPLPDLVRMTSSNPARLVGQFPAKGALQPGSDADLVLVDLNGQVRLTADDLFYRNKHSAYLGLEMTGRVLRTWLRGATVFADGRIMQEPGSGRLLRRSNAASG